MNLQVLHNGTDITSYTVDYVRQQKICSGIGTFELNLVTTYPTTILTWDNFTLYEGGRLVGIYFVNTVKDSEPDAKITVYCQDSSKRLSDYYIAENYLVDYLSYTGDWISQFLSEAGVTYEFRDGSKGVSLSNNTSLGMSTAYEQIMTLLQMSGWYISFEGLTAKIGKLTESSSSASAYLYRTDILDLSIVKHDKMLRNRALVYGTGHQYTGTYGMPDFKDGGWVTAELITHTPYNYDDADVRTSVISNSSIPSKAKANEIAAQMLDSFGHITVEKHITAWGDRDIYLGDFVGVDSDIFNGIGLVTSIGSTMNSGKFTTEIILDERCPRLFNCFTTSPFSEHSDYVYVSTMGSGVFRKPLNGYTWTPFSSGLLDLEIVDLYKNNGILSCVDSSGNSFYANEYYNYWHPITITGLMYNPVGSGIADTVYSGEVHSRAIIQDRLTNNIRVAVDNRPINNSINYANITDGYSTTLLNSAWIVDVSPSTGKTQDSFLLTASGQNNIIALDIENDGRNDFVSVGQLGLGFTTMSGQFEYGHDNTKDFSTSGKVSMHYIKPDATNITPILTTIPGAYTKSISFDNYNNRGICFITTTSLVAKYTDINMTSFSESYTVTLTGITNLIAAAQVSKYVFRLLVVKSSAFHFYTVDVVAGTFSDGGVIAGTENATFSSNGQADKIAYGIRVDSLFEDTYYCYNSKLNLLTLNLVTESLSEEEIFDTGGTIGTPIGIIDNRGVIANVGLGSSIYGDKVNIQFATAGYTRSGSTYTYLNLTAYSYIDGVITNVMSSSAGMSSTNLSLTQTVIKYTSYYTTTLYSSASAGISVNNAHPYIYNSITGNLYSAFIEKYGKYVPKRNGTSGIWELIDIEDGSVLFQYQAAGYTNGFFYRPLTRMDSFSETFYAPMVRDLDSKTGIGEFDSTGTLKNFFLLDSSSDYTDNAENFLWGNAVLYLRNQTDGPLASRNLVLRRDNESFAVVHEGNGNDRLDISNSFPILTVESGLGSTVVLNNYQGSVTNVTTSGIIPNTQFVNDFRYYNEVDTNSGVYNKYYLYSTVSGISRMIILDDGSLDYLNAVVLDIPSGISVVNQLETSNFLSTGQYLFATESGTFYQYDTLSGWMEESTGLPGTYITRIRLDDRI